MLIYQTTLNGREVNMLKRKTLTLLFNEADAVWRSAGSIARRVSINDRDDDGKSLKVSTMHLLYGFWGLKIVAWGSFDFFQYSSDGEPHSLKILCSCSTWQIVQTSKLSTIEGISATIFQKFMWQRNDSRHVRKWDIYRKIQYMLGSEHRES